MGTFQRGCCTVSASPVEAKAQTEQTTEGRIGGESGESTSGQGSKAGRSSEGGTGGNVETEASRRQESRCEENGGEEGTGKGGEEGCAGQEIGSEEDGPGSHTARRANCVTVYSSTSGQYFTLSSKQRNSEEVRIGANTPDGV